MVGGERNFRRRHSSFQFKSFYSQFRRQTTKTLYNEEVELFCVGGFDGAEMMGLVERTRSECGGERTPGYGKL